MSNKVKKIVTWIVVPIMVSIFLLDIFTVILENKYLSNISITKETFTNEYGNDKIHFLNTGNSDCILLESNNHFALIDAGEGSNNPRRKAAFVGYEEVVKDYLKKVASDENGYIHIDFIIATHYHYDHIGSFHSILSDSNIIIDKAYLKEFNRNIDHEYELSKWKIEELYNELLNDVKARNIELIQNIPNKIEFEDFNLKLYNTEYNEIFNNQGDNAESIGIKVSKNSLSAFLAADFTSTTGLEQTYQNEIGKVDLLKIGHHGYIGSSSHKFLKTLQPKIAIVTNQVGKVYPNVKWNLTMVAKLPFYGTYDNNGIIAAFTDENNIKLTNCIH